MLITVFAKCLVGSGIGTIDTKMNQYHHVRNNLILLKYRLLSRFFGRKAVLRIIEYSRNNWDITVGLLLGELGTSQSPRYSQEILLILAGIPSDVLESNELV